MDDTVGFETGNDFGDDNEEFYKVSALFEPNNELSIRLNADYHEVDEAGQGTRVINDGLAGAFVVAAATTDAFGFNAVSNQQDSTPAIIANETNLNGTVSYDFGDINFTSITSYRTKN